MFEFNILSAEIDHPAFGVIVGQAFVRATVDGGGETFALEVDLPDLLHTLQCFQHFLCTICSKQTLTLNPYLRKRYSGIIGV